VAHGRLNSVGGVDMPEPHSAYEDRSVRIVTAGAAIVAAWVQPPNRLRATALKSLVARMTSKHAYVPMFHLINAAKSSPLTLSDEDRREMMGAIREYKGTHAAMALAFEGPAFFVASWRSILSAALLFVRPSYPAKLFSGRAAAAEWLAAQQPASMAERLSAREFVEIVAFAERGLDA
jgi:hypothetical protein